MISAAMAAPVRSLINGNSARVGGRVAPGVQVTEILPDSVVLEHAGRAFRLKALNSWVNL